jgi:hypothetical protein
MSGEIYCIMCKGETMTDSMRTTLFDIAQEMYRERKKKKMIRGHSFEGMVSTKREVAVIGGITGTIFYAVLEYGRTSTTVTYLLRPGDLRGQDVEWEEWDGGVPIDATLN